MLIIADSPTYLLEKVAKSKGIQKVNTKIFPCEIGEKESEAADSALLLFSEIFFKQLRINNITFEELKEISKEIFEEIEILLIRLQDLGLLVYLAMLPKHFLHDYQYRDFFYEKDSKDIYIHFINFSFMMFCRKYSNIVLLKGLDEIDSKISKSYFRFSSIYAKENSEKIIDQLLIHKSKLAKKSKKLIILDLDNTLWKGTVGEEMKEGLRMDQSDPIGSIFYEVQRIILNLKCKGFILAICSKNDEELALDALFNSPSSQFNPNDIVIHRINWEPKSKNIIEICNELNISPKETIFIDDSNYECDEVETNCPEISIIQVPKDIYIYPSLLTSNPLLYLGTSTSEDKQRTDLYKKGLLKKELLNRTIEAKGTKEDWLKSLNIELIFTKVTINNINLDRIVQLFNRTNQFNLSGSKYNKTSFLNHIKSDDRYYYSGSVKDKVGSEGLISILGFSYDGSKIIVEDFVLSCRVFGRGIEESMMVPVIDFACRNSTSLDFKYVNTKRNTAVNNFLIKEFEGYFISREHLVPLYKRYLKMHVSLPNYHSSFFEK